MELCKISEVLVPKKFKFCHMRVLFEFQKKRIKGYLMILNLNIDRFIKDKVDKREILI